MLGQRIVAIPRRLSYPVTVMCSNDGGAVMVGYSAGEAVNFTINRINRRRFPKHLLIFARGNKTSTQEFR